MIYVAKSSINDLNSHWTERGHVTLLDDMFVVHTLTRIIMLFEVAFFL